MRGAIAFVVSALLSGVCVSTEDYGAAVTSFLFALNYMMPAPPKGERP